MNSSKMLRMPSQENLEIGGNEKFIFISSILLWLFIVVIYFFNLWGGSLRTWDESLTAERSREFLLTDDIWLPHLNFSPDFNKPPLYYWLSALTFKIFGVNEFSVRFWSVIFAIGCMIFVYQMGCKLSGNRWIALFSLFLLATNPHWINKTREGLLDSGLLCGMLGGIYFLCFSVRSRGKVFLSGLFLAIGGLIKGPLVLLSLIIPISGLIFKKRKIYGTKDIIFVLCIYLLVVLPYYVIQFIRWGNEYGERYFYYNIIDRFFQGIEGHGREPFFYFTQLLKLSPVSLIYFLASLGILLKRTQRQSHVWAPFLLFTLVWFIIINISASKRDLYLLVLYPFVAMITGLLGGELVQLLRNLKLRNGLICVSMIIPICFFIDNYQFKLDFNPYLKQIGIYLKNVYEPQDSVIVEDGARNVVLFYSEIPQPIQIVSIKTLPEVLKGNFIQGKNKTYMVVRKNKKAEFVSQIQSISMLESQIIYENKKFIIILILSRFFKG